MPLVDHHVLLKIGGERIVANPFSHHHHWRGITSQTITTRPANTRDIIMALSAANTDILDKLAAHYTKEEFASVAETLGYTEKEIREYEEKGERNEWGDHEIYFRTFLIAEIASAVIQHKGTVDIPGIVSASEESLPDYEAWYMENLRQIFNAMVELEKKNETANVRDISKWVDLYAGKGWVLDPETGERTSFQRQAELLSQVQMRLGRYAENLDTAPS